MTRDEKLDHLAKVVTNAPNDQFDMELWHCETSSCAAGWAARDPTFIKEGLRLKQNDIAFKNNRGFYALEDFFGLSSMQSLDLFSGSGVDGNSDGDPTGAEQKAAFLRRLAKLQHELSETEELTP